MARCQRADAIISAMGEQLDAFVSGLSTRWQAEFEGLHSVLVDYVLCDLSEGSVDHALASLLIGAVSQEVDRLVAAALPFTQEICVQLAKSFEALGEIYDDVQLSRGSAAARNMALVSYELAVVWYRVVKTTYTGVLPVQSQLRLVQSLIRLGAINGSRETFRRAILELFFLIDDDKFLSLMTRQRSVPVTEAEREGLLAYRQRLRKSVRETMIEAVTHLHRSVPERMKKEYRTLEEQISARRRGPGDLLHFLARVTVIPELALVEGGRDSLADGEGRSKYMNMREHVQEVATALEALEARDPGYFWSRLAPADRQRLSLPEFAKRFGDVLDDYHAFSQRSDVSRLNFWIALLLHDVGRILQGNHHRGGAVLVESLLEALGIGGVRQASILDYVRYHGQWKRFYFLENSPKEVLEYARVVGEEHLPYMLLEKRRIESIVDLAATGHGHLTLDFIEESRRFRNLAHLEELAANFGSRRLTQWGLRSPVDLYGERVEPGERLAFLDRYLAEVRIVHCHNLARVLRPEELLKFHYLCARLAALEGFPVQEVRVNSDKVEDLEAVGAALGALSWQALRASLAGLSVPPNLTSPRARADFVTRELFRDPGLLVEFKNGNATLSVNATYVQRAAAGG